MIQSYSKALLLNTVQERQKDITARWNRIKGPEVDPQIYGQLILKEVQWHRNAHLPVLLSGPPTPFWGQMQFVTLGQTELQFTAAF